MTRPLGYPGAAVPREEGGAGLDYVSLGILIEELANPIPERRTARERRRTMDAVTFFLTRYGDLHGRSTGDLLAGLGDEQLRRRPHPAVNTIAWLLWHMARIEDVGVNRLIAGRPQVLDEEGWPERLKVGRRDVGTGMDDAEVDDLSARVDLAALRGYWDALDRRTLDVAGSLGAEDLDVPVAAEDVRRVCLDEGASGERAPRLADFWTGRTRGWLLAQLALVHPFGHLYEARVVKGLWGIRSV